MKIFTGIITAKKSEKTVTIAVTRVMAHTIYKKRIKRIKKYQVHDELGASVGQRVNFVASRPYSKTKKWKVLEIVSKQEGKKKSSAKKGETK